MKLHRLYREQTIARPLDDVFEFFSRPENLARITPPSMGFEILTPSPIDMRAGALIDYTVRAFGVPVRWTSSIAAFDPPNRFVDLQLRGPYSFWHHTHTFKAVDGGTRISDEVRYALPFGPLARLVHMLFVKRQLERIFDFREAAVERLLTVPPHHRRGQSGQDQPA